MLDTEPHATEHAEPHRHRHGALARLRGYLVAGILVTAPTALTLYITWQIVNAIDASVRPLIPDRYNPETYLPFNLPGLGLVVVIVGLTLIGWITAGLLGRIFLRISEAILARMPFIRGLYTAIKQIVETILAQKSNAFRQVVLVEYPREGCWTLAFVSGVTPPEVARMAKRELISVYVPTTPNPTSGFLLYLPRDRVIPLSISVEEGIKLIVSCGIVQPPDRGKGAPTSVDALQRVEGR
jgi:uncharacterized membrane protein